MKRIPLSFWAILVIIGCVVFLSWNIAGAVTNDRSWKLERCKKLRREFFAGCLAVEPRYRCEVQWAQLDGKVFDADPSSAWADQVDCSGELK